MQDKSKDKIEKLKSRLYSRSYNTDKVGERSAFNTEQVDGPTDWQSGDRIGELLSRNFAGEKKSVWAKRIFIFSLIFFAIAAGLAVFMFMGGLNAVSTKNVDIEVGGPISIAGGESNEFEITIKNGNNVPLQNAYLLVTYPTGARDAETKAPLSSRERISLGQIDSGRTGRQKLTFIAYGEKDSVQTLDLAVEYTVPGSNATFVKEKKHDVTISSAPLIVDVTYPQQVTSGQLVGFTAEIASNSTETIDNVVVRIEPPFGFTLEGSQPEVVASNVWNIGTLKPAEKKTITFSGRLTGQDKDERSFRIYVGTGTDTGTDIDTELIALTETLEISRPFISLSSTINGQAGNEIVLRGERFNSGTIYWKNTTPNKLSDMVIEAQIIGAPLNRSSVRAPQGFYQSVRDTIVWDKTTDPSLASIDVGEENSFDFSFDTLAGNFSESDGVIEIILTAHAVRTTDTKRETVESQTTQHIRLAAGLGISGRAVYSVGPFTNTGPVPPQAEKPTTYTIILTTTASFGDIANVVAHAKLPLSVEWLGVVSPTSESLTYNPDGRTLEWSLGTVSEGTGTTRPAREVAFQVRLTPSVSQLNTLAHLIDDIGIIGQDSRAGTSVLDSMTSITTSLSTDPAYNQSSGFVTK